MGNSQSAGASDANVDGLYDLQEIVTYSTCHSPTAGSTGTDTMTVTVNDGTITEQIDAIGGSCSGPLDGNRATWSCDITNAQGQEATLQISATFNNGDVSGGIIIAGSGCQFAIQYTGKRQ